MGILRVKLGNEGIAADRNVCFDWIQRMLSVKKQGPNENVSFNFDINIKINSSIFYFKMRLFFLKLQKFRINEVKLKNGN